MEQGKSNVPAVQGQKASAFLAGVQAVKQGTQSAKEGTLKDEGKVQAPARPDRATICTKASLLATKQKLPEITKAVHECKDGTVLCLFAINKHFQVEQYVPFQAWTGEPGIVYGQWYARYKTYAAALKAFNEAKATFG